MDLLAKNVTSANVVSIRADDSVLQCAQLLRDRNITGAPVVDEDQNLVGVISIRDLLPERRDDEDQEGFYNPIEIKAEFMEGGVARIVDGNRLVQEIMATDVISCGQETPLEELAEIMHDHGINRILVVEAGKVCGIVSTTDILELIEKGELEP